MVCFTTLVCLLISGCGDSSKDQIIAVYDYSGSTEKEYGAEDKTADDLVNQLCDYFLDGESETEEIPGEASGYKRIDVFQTDGHASAGQQKTDGNRSIHINCIDTMMKFTVKPVLFFQIRNTWQNCPQRFQHRWKSWRRKGSKNIMERRLSLWNWF